MLPLMSRSHLHRSCCLLFLTLAAACASPAVTQEELRGQYDAALKKVKSGDMRSAVEDLNRILTELPTEVNVLCLRAHLKYKIGDKGGARSDIALALKLGPQNAEPLRVRAYIRYYDE